MDLAIQSLGIPTGLVGWKLIEQKSPANFPAFMQDPVLQREISYFEKNAPQATTAKALLSNPQLQDFVLTAYGLTSDSGMTALMEKVLNSTPNDPTSFASKMVDVRYQNIANAFNYGGTVTPAKAAVASSAQVSLGNVGTGSGFAAFSGTFAGVSVGDVNMVGVDSPQDIAKALQTAFQRADGNRKDITVSVNGNNLTFSDDKGRGTATAFAWSNDPLDTGSGPTAGAPQNLVAGSLAQAAQGGPAVTSSSFIKQVVQLYTEAQFQEVIGNSSNTLREAVYAQKQLPTIKNWYSVIADPALANVVETVLGLPQSFQMTNVDQQVKVLASRMNIADFQNSTKVNNLLNQFVVQSQAQAVQPSQTPASLLLSGLGSTGIVNVTVPSAYTTPPNTYSSNSAAAMLLSTAVG